MITIHPTGGDDTSLIQETLNRYAGVDTVTLSSGTWNTRCLDIPSKTHLILQHGAELSFSDNPEDYPAVKSRWEGVLCWCMHPLFFIHEAEDVVIEGTGVLNGNGQRWWDYIFTRRADQKEPETELEKKFASLNPEYKNEPGGGGGRQCQFLRPPLLQIYNSRNISLSSLRIVNSPFWTVHTVFSENLELENLIILNPYHTPNTDGIDIESSSDVKIKGCLIDVGDDGIALKSGSGMNGYLAAKPTERVTISGCTVKQAHGGFVIGSETAGGVSDVLVEDCEFIGTDRGIRIKTRRGRGGHIKNIHAKNIVIKDTICPVTLNMFYRWGSDSPELYSTEKQPINDLTPSISNVLIEGIKASGCRASLGFFAGLPEAPITNVTIRDSVFEIQKNIENGLEVEMYRGIEETDYRGIRVLFTQLKAENNKINVDPPILIEK